MRFIAAQGYRTKTVLYQDNLSTMLLETNGRASAGKRSRHLDMRYFFIHDLVDKKIISVQHCPTEEMDGDYMSKPLHGNKFVKFRERIMNFATTEIEEKEK